MGVKQTTDVLEKGTWILAAAVVILCLFSTVFIPKAASNKVRDVKAAPTSTSVPAAPLQQK
jgi:preprotein translocase subunit SecG